MSDQPTRFHAIDHLRATMISIVMFGHALLPYTTIPRSFKDPETHIGFDVAAIFLYSFAMPLFFVTAGFSTALIFYRKGQRGLWQNRVHRILIPLVIAYFALTPLTRVAYKFAKGAASSGSLQAGIDAVQFADWVHWGKAYHLWFLVSLLLFSVLAIWLRRGLLQIAGDRLDTAVVTSRRLLTGRWRATLLALAAATIMVPAYVFYGSDATTLPMQFVLFGFFLLGWVLYLNRDLLPTLQIKAWQSVAVALAVSPLAVWSTREQMMSPDDVQTIIVIIVGLSNSVLAAFMTFGLLGIYQARFNAASAFGRYISDASYWIFLIHFPLLIAVAGAVSVLPYPALLNYLMTLAIVVPIVFSTYHFVVRRRT
jgi:peptidoglycan/LPS O-acetylase OafA/YrhL